MSLVHAADLEIYAKSTRTNNPLLIRCADRLTYCVLYQSPGKFHMPDMHVSANYRFVGAYQEINTRIAQRQQALAIYVSLVLSLLAALVALKPGTAGSALPVQWLVMGFPVASTFLALMSYKAERAITNLRHFLCVLERLENENEIIPSYNANPMWSISANHARQFQDYAAALLVLGGNLIGLFAAIKIYPAQFSENPMAIWAAGLLALASFIGLLWIPKLSFTPKTINDIAK